ncbi:cupredoxin domain-containing protein [Verminephrobacter eiseniae]|nr:cupredoxin domain-containing protein [Verminephrobacter eiseniae]
MAVNPLERRGMLNKRWCLAFLGMSMAMSALAAGEDLPVFRLDCNNGVFTPKQLLVPAGKKFKIEIYNTGTEAIEFESRQLRKEKALSPQSNSFVVVFPLEPGEYKFFDDFHIQTGQGSIIAK